MKTIFALIIGLGIVACTSNPKVHKKQTRILEYSCSNGYTVKFQNKKEITDSDSSETIKLIVRHEGIQKKYQLEPIPAGSGAKYKTTKGKFIFWEHHGEAIFGTEDSTYCTCN